MIEQTDIPDHWEMRTFSDITKNISGGATPKKSNQSYWTDGVHDWATTSDYPDSKYIGSSSDSITEAAINQTSAKLFPKGTLFVTIIATIGEVCINKHPMALNQQSVAIKVDPKVVNNEFLYYAIRNLKPILESKSRGGAYPAINQSILKEIQVPIPPLEEQERIVSVLDAAFGSTRRINSLSEDVAEYTTEFNDAMSHATLGPENIPDHWETKSLTDVATVNPRTSLPEQEDYAYVPMDAIDPQSHEITRFERRADVYSGLAKFKTGDIVVARITPCFENGNTVLVDNIPDDDEVVVGSSELVVVRPEDISSRYLFNYLKCPVVTQWGRQRMSGATGRERVKISQFRNELQIPVPPQHEQERILSTLDASQSSSRYMEDRTMTVQAYGTQIKDAVLAQAFTGQLSV